MPERNISSENQKQVLLYKSTMISYSLVILSHYNEIILYFAVV